MGTLREMKVRRCRTTLPTSCCRAAGLTSSRPPAEQGLSLETSSVAELETAKDKLCTVIELRREGSSAGARAPLPFGLVDPPPRSSLTARRPAVRPQPLQGCLAPFSCASSPRRTLLRAVVVEIERANTSPRPISSSSRSHAPPATVRLCAAALCILAMPLATRSSSHNRHRGCVALLLRRRPLRSATSGSRAR